METLIVYPENKEQLDALTAVMKAMKIAFVQEQQEEATYPETLIATLNKSLKQANEGKLTPYTGIADMLKRA